MIISGIISNRDERQVLRGCRPTHVRIRRGDFVCPSSILPRSCGASIHERFHPQEEVYEVIEGKLELTIDGQTQVASPGVVAIVPAGARHSVTRHRRQRPARAGRQRDPTPRPSADHRRIEGINRHGMGILHKKCLVAEESRIVGLTPQGAAAQNASIRLLAAIEDRWQARSLRDSLERIVHGLEIADLYRGGWRSKVRQPDTLLPDDSAPRRLSRRPLRAFPSDSVIMTIWNVIRQSWSHPAGY
jgi:mannose-6-phosphate isomerase-like protein (cupin superfamily)